MNTCPRANRTTAIWEARRFEAWKAGADAAFAGAPASSNPHLDVNEPASLYDAWEAGYDAWKAESGDD